MTSRSDAAARSKDPPTGYRGKGAASGVFAQAAPGSGDAAAPRVSRIGRYSLDSPSFSVLAAYCAVPLPAFWKWRQNAECGWVTCWSRSLPLVEYLPYLSENDAGA